MNDFNNFNKFHLSNILSLVWPTSASLEMIYEKNCVSQHFTIKAYQRYFYDFYSDLIMHFFTVSLLLLLVSPPSKGGMQFHKYNHLASSFIMMCFISKQNTFNKCTFLKCNVISILFALYR